MTSSLSEARSTSLTCRRFYEADKALSFLLPSKKLWKCVFIQKKNGDSLWSRHINTSPGELPAGLNTGWEEESEGGKKKDRRRQEERKWEEEALNQERDAEISPSGKMKVTNHSLYIKIWKTND